MIEPTEGCGTLQHMSDEQSFVDGYAAAISDLNGSCTFLRYDIIAQDIDAAGRAAYADREWLAYVDSDYANALDSSERRNDPPPAPKMGTVYVIVAGELVKIGFTRRATGFRLEEIAAQCGHEPVLIAQFEGTAELERELHERFASIRVKGEWFTDDGQIRQWARSWQK